MPAAPLSLVTSAADASPGPFVQRVEPWSRGERAILTGEFGARNRCRASYDIGCGGVAMRQRLRCVMASYNFDLQTIMAHLGGGMGDWSDTIHKARGLVNTTASTHRVSARGQVMSDLTAAMTGNSLRITFLPFGTDVRARRDYGNA
jgi:hypothetical protein